MEKAPHKGAFLMLGVNGSSAYFDNMIIKLRGLSKMPEQHKAYGSG